MRGWTMTLPIRSGTLDTLDNARWHMDALRAALESELAAVYAEIDRLRAECARLKEERDVAVAALREVLKP